MIRTVADFLEKLKSVGLEQINEKASNIVHRPTIGNIYEGLSKELLEKAIFQELDISIVKNCFIQSASRGMSHEMDVMIVTGEGQNIPYTDQYVYAPEQIIAVVQVKKKLFRDDIQSSFKNLKNACAVNEPRETDNYVVDLLRDSYKSILGRDLPDSNKLDKYSEQEQLFYHGLLMESFHPLRIVLGYFGYKDEYGLREGFVKMLESQTSSTEEPLPGFGAFSFPNLIICGNSSIIKNVGMPGAIPLNNTKYYWPVLQSSPHNAMYQLVELIWTRLAYKYQISADIFGDDHDLQVVHPFMDCYAQKINSEQHGWAYRYRALSADQLNVPLKNIPYSPTDLNDVQCSVMRLLMNKGQIDFVNDREFRTYLSKNDYSTDQLITELKQLRMIYLEANIIKPLPDQFAFVFTPDGRILAGENRSGELDHWMMKHKDLFQK